MKKLISAILAVVFAFTLIPTTAHAASAHPATWTIENGKYSFYMSNGQKMVNDITPEGVYIDAQGNATNFWVVEPTVNKDGTVENWGAFNTPAVYPISFPYYASSAEATIAYRNNSVSKNQFESLLKNFNQVTWFLGSSYNYLNDKASREAMKQDLVLMNNYNFVPYISSTDAQVRLEAYVAEMQRMAYCNYLSLAIQYKDAGDNATAEIYKSLLMNSLNTSRNVLTTEQNIFQISGSPYYGYPSGSDSSSANASNTESTSGGGSII